MNLVLPKCLGLKRDRPACQLIGFAQVNHPPVAGVAVGGNPHGGPVSVVPLPRAVGGVLGADGGSRLVQGDIFRGYGNGGGVKGQLGRGVHHTAGQVVALNAGADRHRDSVHLEGIVAAASDGYNSAISDNIGGNTAKGKIGDAVPALLVEPPFDHLVHCVDMVESQHVFKEQGDGAQRGPAAEILADNIPVFSGRRVGTGGVGLPNGVGGDIFIGLILLLQNLFRRLVRAGGVSVILQALDAHVGRGQPQPAAPIGAGGVVEVGVVPGDGGEVHKSAEGGGGVHMGKQRLGLGCVRHQRQHRPEGGDSFHFVFQKGVCFVDVVIDAVRLIPIILVNQ